ncbi:MAG: hypothetical protein WAZ19_16520 [Anaerolineae bacterium]
MQVYLAGIMQGSHPDDAMHGQGYRAFLTDLLRTHAPQMQVFDPWVAYPDSQTYPDERARTVLVDNVMEAAASDVVIAYLPQASMGTALEMWEAWRAGATVIAITPLAGNWVVRTCAAQRYATLDEFAAAVQAGALAGLTPT